MVQGEHLQGTIREWESKEMSNSPDTHVTLSQLAQITCPLGVDGLSKCGACSFYVIKKRTMVGSRQYWELPTVHFMK